MREIKHHVALTMWSFPGWALDATRQGRTLSAMRHGRKKFYGYREAPKKRPPLGLAITLAAAAGVVVGSAGTYVFFKPQAAPTQSVSPAAAAQPQVQTMTTPQQQFTPAPQPPGEPPPGKVWSVEHGHWHDAPVALTIPVSATATSAPATNLPPVPATVPAPGPTPAPAAPPAEKKE